MLRVRERGTPARPTFNSQVTKYGNDNLRPPLGTARERQLGGGGWETELRQIESTNSLVDYTESFSQSTPATQPHPFARRTSPYFQRVARRGHSSTVVAGIHAILSRAVPEEILKIALYGLGMVFAQWMGVLLGLRRTSVVGTA